MKRTFRGGFALLAGISAVVWMAMPRADAQIGESGRTASSIEMDSKIDGALADIGDSFRSTGPGAWKGTVVFSDGRRQTVEISTDNYAFAVGDDVARARRIESHVMTSGTGLPERLVRRLMADHDGPGSYRLRSVGGSDRLDYVVVVPDTLPAGQFGRAVQSAALVADEMESELAKGRDRY